MTAPRPEVRPAGTARSAWAELLRISALFTVPGDALAGTAAAGHRPGRGTALAAGTSLCLYEAGMALNDWADRGVDAVERPQRPLPSGRIAPDSALAAAAGLTAAGLGLAAAAGRPALATATALAGTVWAYDLWLKNTAAGPAAMACARALDVALGAVAADGPPEAAAGTRGGTRPRPRTGRGPAVRALRAALPPALLMGAHTLAVTTVARREAEGGSWAAPLAAMGAVGAVAGRAARRGGAPAAFAGAYAATAARPLLHAALNPSPQLTQRAVGGGLQAMIPLQAALAARAGSARTALPLLALLPVARRLSRKVSPT